MSINQFTVCPWCEYKRQESDSSPVWQCPRCAKAYNKAPRQFVVPKRELNTKIKQQPRHTFTAMTVHRLLSLLVAVIDALFRKSQQWSTLNTQLTVEDYFLCLAVALCLIWFGEPVGHWYYRHFPLRTGFDVFARKNPDEEKLLIAFLPRVYLVIGWALLLWFVFFN